MIIVICILAGVVIAVGALFSYKSRNDQRLTKERAGQLDHDPSVGRATAGRGDN